LGDSPATGASMIGISIGTEDERAAVVRAAIDLALATLTGVGLTPEAFARSLAGSDDPEAILIDTREAADALASWLLPAVQCLDLAYIRGLPPADRDELPAAFIAGITGQ